MDGEELFQRCASLEHAVTCRDTLERRLREQPHSASVRLRSLTACEQVLRARTGLYRCLIREGWQPPPHVVRAMLDDELLLDEPSGPLEA